MSVSRKLGWFVGGGVCGTLAASWGSIGPLAVVVFAAWLLPCVSRIAPNEQERRWLLRWLMVALSLRLVAAVGGMAVAWSTGIGSDIFGDARAYSYSGNYVAERLRGGALSARYVGNDGLGLEYMREVYPHVLPSMSQYQVGLMGYGIGVLYSVVGYSPLTVKWLNALMGVVSIVLLYDLVRRIGGTLSGRVAALLFVFWPSLFLWSITGLKDTIALMALLIPLWLVVRGHWGAIAIACLCAAIGFRAWLLLMGVMLIVMIASCLRRSWFAMAVVCGWTSLITFVLLKQDVGKVVVVALLVLVVLVADWRWKRLGVVIVGTSLLLTCVLQGQRLVTRMHGTIGAAMGRAAHIHVTGALLPGTVYRVYPSRFFHAYPNVTHAAPLEPMEFVATFLRGLVCAIGVPFPWLIPRSWGQMIAWPQMVMSYLFFPVALVGAGCWFWNRWREGCVVLGVCAVIVCVYALVLWNVGATLRLRDIVVPYFLACVALGWVRLTQGADARRGK